MPNKTIKKGFRLEVVSWENDADYPRTETMDFEDKKEAMAVRKMARELFVGEDDEGIGNSDDREDAENRIFNYIQENPKLAEIKNIDIEDFEEVVDMVMEYNYELLGYSEYYFSRVYERSDLYVIPEDIVLEKI